MGANETITVLNPVGFAPVVTRKELAPRLDTLASKTVYLVDCRFDDSDVFLGQMQAWFAEHMPAVKTIVKPISSVYLKDDPTTWEIRARGHAHRPCSVLTAVLDTQVILKGAASATPSITSPW